MVISQNNCAKCFLIGIDPGRDFRDSKEERLHNPDLVTKLVEHIPIMRKI